MPASSAALTSTATRSLSAFVIERTVRTPRTRRGERDDRCRVKVGEKIGPLAGQVVGHRALGDGSQGGVADLAFLGRRRRRVADGRPDEGRIA